MTVEDAKRQGIKLLNWLRALPLAIQLTAAAVVAASAVTLGVEFGDPGWTTLYDGLSPAAGGTVIDGLQKLGIQYRLVHDGSQIEVPSADLGRARLELGQQDIPASTDGGAWKQLENVPMTSAQAAIDAMKLRASETSLESTIQSITGAAQVKVLLAIPADTPFLADQQNAKASVVLVDPPRADEALGATVASVVASAVPGVDAKSVVVAASDGRVLYPVSDDMSADDQLALDSQIEATMETKIRTLLDPVFGPKGYRIAVSANVDYTRTRLRSVAYGPTALPLTSTSKSDSSVGGGDLAMGIPGALSNQPPGPTTAPTTAPASGPAGQNNPTAAHQGGGTTDGIAAAGPHSSSTENEASYAIDQTNTDQSKPSWSVTGVAISVVVDQALLGKLTPDQIEALIAAGIAVRDARISVLPAAFVADTSVPVDEGNLSGLVRNALLLIGAFLLLIGVGVPVGRRIAAARLAAPRIEVNPIGPDGHGKQARRELDIAIEKIRIAAQDEPVVIARTLQKWVENG